MNSKRGPYAPRRPAAGVNWAAEEAAASAARAEAARVDDQARDAAARAQEEFDPLAQLVKRCHAIEVEMERKAGVLQGAIAALEDRVAALEGGVDGEPQEQSKGKRWRR